MINKSMDLEKIRTSLPFISAIRVGKDTFLGIIQNSDEKIISFYDVSLLRTSEEKKLFLDLGAEWWNESNRLLPISIFLSDQMRSFRYCLRSVPSKESEVLFGPITSLTSLVKKRFKRKQVELVRKM